MKKLLAALLSVVLAVTFCVPAFAEDTTGSALSEVIDVLSSVLNGGSWDSLSDTQKEQLKSTLDDILFEKEDSGELVTDADGNYVVSAPANAIAQVLTSNTDYDDAIAALDEMQAAGVLSEMAYAALRGEMEELSSVDASIEASRQESGETTTNPVDGVRDFFGSIVDTIGGLLGGLFGGGDSGDTPTTTRRATTTTSSGDDDSFSNTKTGDVALVSVAGVALVAGLALILTKKKES